MKKCKGHWAHPDAFLFTIAENQKFDFIILLPICTNCLCILIQFNLSCMYRKSQLIVCTNNY